MLVNEEKLNALLGRLFGDLSAGYGGVMVSLGQLLLAALSLAVIGAVVLALRLTAFGRAYRACADDLGAWDRGQLVDRVVLGDWHRNVARRTVVDL